ncbi:MAG: hypothetical protein JF886_01025 [Candidatus Dormibacteraeota bacterium]|uniref:Uncharacterized protein n=1 Tax=Candidatus Aeolococcus gillhamiae TaxID=3127015 RepID=A0A934N8P8_9BACT|nr:hypothetical protein [Candidatus Dormibacteraeota bacterium]
MLLLPLLVALIVLLVLRARNRRNTPAGAHQAPVIVYVAGSILAGGAAAFISLEAYYGIIVAGATGVLLFQRSQGQRWFSLGGFLVGFGACAAGFLSAALTNRDPAVTYDPSTIPLFWVGVVVAVGGMATIVLAATRPLRSRIG